MVFELREIGSRLRPAVLDDLGIISALEWLLEDVAKRSDFKTHLSVDNISEEERLPSDTELALFRITQEAASNAVKHSRGNNLNVWLRNESGAVVLQISDNGVGYLKPANGSGGFGLPGMRERATQLNGSFEIQATPGRGTTITVKVPLLDAAPALPPSVSGGSLVGRS